MAMSGVCRCATRTMFKNVRTTTATATTMVANALPTPPVAAPCATAAAVRALSYEAGRPGQQSPWNGHGGGGEWDGGRGRPRRRPIERRPGDW